MNSLLLSTLSPHFSKTLIFFFPKSNTPGCTLESRDFSALLPEFHKLGVEIVGVSRDTGALQQKFCDKNNLSIKMVSDTDENLHRFFAVMGIKKSFGIKREWVIRSTFLIDSKTGEILREWRNIRAIGHAKAVLEYLKTEKE